MIPIDYLKIANAVEYYKLWGFKEFHAPWIVGKEAYSATKPSEKKRDFETFAGNLVASGEQSFVEMMIAGKLPRGKLLCVTPCFRDDRVSRYNQKYFMKVELIYTGKDLAYELADFLVLAKHFFSTYIEKNVRIERTREGFDILGDGIELGSYGIRELGPSKWVYGTGCAEPRLSLAIQSSFRS